MSIDKMVSELIQAQKEIGEPITISRKTEKTDEIHNAYSGAGLDLITLQIAAITDLFENMIGEMDDREAKVVGNALVSSITAQIEKKIADKSACEAPNIH